MKETIILTNEDNDFYEVYTFNYALKKKLAAFAKKHPDLCSLKETTKEGSTTYVVDKAVTSSDGAIQRGPEAGSQEKGKGTTVRVQKR